MTPHTLNNYSVIIPEMPEGATEISVWPNAFKFWHEESKSVNMVALSPGNWQLLKLSEVSESLAGKMVEKERDPWGFNGWMNYDKGRSSALDFNFDTAHASLSSWVRAQGVTENDPYLLINKMG